MAIALLQAHHILPEPHIPIRIVSLPLPSHAHGAICIISFAYLRRLRRIPTVCLLGGFESEFGEEHDVSLMSVFIFAVAVIGVQSSYSIFIIHFLCFFQSLAATGVWLFGIDCYRSGTAIAPSTPELVNLIVPRMPSSPPKTNQVHCHRFHPSTSTVRNGFKCDAQHKNVVPTTPSILHNLHCQLLISIPSKHIK